MPDDAFYSFSFYRDAPDDDPLATAPRDLLGATPAPQVGAITLRIGRFASMDPLAAVRAWLGLEFGAGFMLGFDEEAALCFAIRKDPGISLGDDVLIDIFAEILESGEFEDEGSNTAEAAEDVLALLREVSAGATRPARRRR